MKFITLRYFITINEYGSMSSAASVLGVSESALSQGVSQLERDLGAALFFRNGRRLCLTPAGKKALVPARMLVNRANQLLGSIGRDIGAGGHVDFVVEPALATDPMVEIVSEVRRRLPDIRIRIRSAEETGNRFEMLREGLSQFAIVYKTRCYEEFARLLLGQHVLWVVFPPGSDVEGRETVALEELEGMRMVGVPRGAAQREFLDDVLKRFGVRTRVVVETDNRAQLVPLVLSGVGATIVPEARALEAALRGAVVRKLSPRIGRTYELVWMREETTLEMASIIAIAREMVANGSIGGGHAEEEGEVVPKGSADVIRVGLSTDMAQSGA